MFLKKIIMLGTTVLMLPAVAVSSNSSNVDLNSKSISSKKYKKINNSDDVNSTTMNSPDGSISYELNYGENNYSVYQIVGDNKIFIEGDLNFNIKEALSLQESDNLIYGGLGKIKKRDNYIRSLKAPKTTKNNLFEADEFDNFDILNYLNAEDLKNMHLNNIHANYQNGSLASIKSSDNNSNKLNENNFCTNIHEYKKIKNWQYFYNLKVFPNNYYGTCGLVAASILLGYFDEYYDDDLIIDSQKYSVTSNRIEGYLSNYKEPFKQSYYESTNVSDNKWDKVRGTTDAFASYLADNYLSTYLDYDHYYDHVKACANNKDQFMRDYYIDLKKIFDKAGGKAFPMDEQNVRDTILNYMYGTGRYEDKFEINPRKRKLGKKNGKGGFYVWLNRQACVRSNIEKDINKNIPSIGIMINYKHKEIEHNQKSLKSISAKSTASDVVADNIGKIKSLIRGHDVLIYGKKDDVFLCHIGWDPNSLYGTSHAINSSIINGHCSMEYYK